MKTKCNELMRHLMKGQGRSTENLHAEIPKPLLKRLQLGFKEFNGVIVPKDHFKAPSISRDDETGLECLMSKEHLEDFLPDSVSVQALVSHGTAYADKLRESLEKSGLHGHFRVIISAIPEDRTCTIRFHRVRPGQTWLDADLETYKSEAVMTIDFNTSMK